MKYLLILFMGFVAGCSAQTKMLPSTRPADLQVNYHYDGGMLYYMEDLLLSKDSCVYMKNDNGKKITKRFRLSPAEMDELYAILLTNKFDQIESKSETGVYDRGGITVRANWDKNKKLVEVSDAQTTFVNEKWRKEWQGVSNYITSLILHKTNG